MQIGDVATPTLIAAGIPILTFVPFPQDTTFSKGMRRSRSRPDPTMASGQATGDPSSASRWG